MVGLSRKSWADPYGYGTGRPEERHVSEAPPPSFSGIYDASGQPLYRHPNPVGFETDQTRRFK